ncbi:ABC transporter substrate-binding protein [Paenibacillus apiarius]|uniref:ABC transporter substrate-binding protein n=1 Tax=Paenibacillus apiarius TaxID=46240 RepID=A0ABT4DW20_9BACL|nr:ABC transporter substrate-binding protein [Paenibacillus apiarius]MCY9513098.1 ABC transporter substrate-binding protein [Paenibacillus apiarius]MCY9521544.1 ABC transporter substrate-binding protein [Paenibacillus apiarius]MCY9551698.1 ABC transporter substrate-binding protein [Paenibacillus apiarius]MCY9560514.1 ABC transporter substrate-binding protein [Paenibacillus apiarius]MCY9685236.1 ABC transporter substrate-binding protein [Paenibacillus apiarius]
MNRKFRQLTGMSPGEFRHRPQPTRIAAFQFVGHLLAFGITPVATDSMLMNNTLLLKNELDGVKVVSHNHGLEQLHDLEVDLIIAPTYFYNIPDRIKSLEKIAPVVTIEWGKMDCLEEARLFGKLLGKEQEAERWIDRYLEKVRQAKERLEGHLEPGETVALYEIREDRIGIWDRTARGAFNLYDMLGLTPPERVQQEVLQPGTHLFITEAALPEYAADVMFVVYESNGSYPDLNKQVANSNVWRNLPAARHNRIYPLKLEEFWCCDALSLERQLDKQVDLLASGTEN